VLVERVYEVSTEAIARLASSSELRDLEGVRGAVAVLSALLRAGLALPAVPDTRTIEEFLEDVRRDAPGAILFEALVRRELGELHLLATGVAPPGLAPHSWIDDGWASTPIHTNGGRILFAEVRAALNAAWQPLRAGNVDRDEIARAEEAASIVLACAAGGIDLRPDDAGELADALPDENMIGHALTTAEAEMRPGFPGEDDFERWLREGGALYHVWASSSCFRGDRVAAWRATDAPRTILCLACGLGISNDELVRAFARFLIQLAPEPEVAAILETIAANGVELADGRKQWLAERYAKVHQQRNAAHRRQTADENRRDAILDVCAAFVSGGLDGAIARAALLTRITRDAGARLRACIEPLLHLR